MTESKDTSVKSTLKELANKLPIEIKGKENQFFTFKNWGMPEEKKIAEIKGENPNMGRFISQMMYLLLDTLHGEDFGGQEEAKKILTINQLPMGDVLYMFIYLRYDQLSEDISMGFHCPNCQKLVKDWVADLGDLDVDCKRGDWEDTVTYKLKKPITLEKGEQLIDNLKLTVAKWDAMERATEEIATNDAARQEHQLKACLQGSEGYEGHLDANEVINKLAKKDLEYLQKVISSHNAGPSIQAEVQCSRCKHKYLQMIDWSYDNFFGASSLPQS